MTKLLGTRATVALLATLLGVAGCGDDDGPAAGTDAGSVSTDAGGGRTDSGPGGTDGGGVAVDSGGVATDAGGVATDAGGTATDGGNVGSDGGGTVGASCGGRGGRPCGRGLFCDWAPADNCGRADATGTCQPIPEFCTDEIDPVCGCDGMTYSNGCEAHAAGISIESRGSCTAG